MGTTIRCDVAIVGAGLAGGLTALALAARHPQLDVRLIDEAGTIGGNHIWSFFAGDVAAADRWLADPIVAHQWPRYEVAFPGHRRTIAQRYYATTSDRLDAAVRARLPAEALLLGSAAAEVTPIAVVLANSDRIEAAGVIDARGPGDLATLELGWQKFVGAELTLAEPHRVTLPTVMDATVAQHDGYRFVYTLPLAANRMLVEDTYYSDAPDLDRAALRDRIDRYAQDHGWQPGSVDRVEHGVLPVALGGDFEAYWRSTGAGIAKAGMRAGLFHPTTGYSLPDAVRTAAMLAARTDFSAAGLHEATHALAATTWRRRGFYRLVDTLLFRAADPDQRYRVLERFYRLSPGLIGRFYAGRSTMADKARVLIGKPPVPFWRAVGIVAAGGMRW